MMTKEMMKLVRACHALELPISVEPDGFGGSMVILLDANGDRIGDAVSHGGSYGYKEGLIEIMGKGCEDDVKEYLTACDVIHLWTRKEEVTNED